MTDLISEGGGDSKPGRGVQSSVPREGTEGEEASVTPTVSSVVTKGCGASASPTGLEPRAARPQAKELPHFLTGPAFWVAASVCRTPRWL